MDQAVRNVGPRGANETPQAWGTRIHTELARLVRELGDPEIHAEISYLGREQVDYGTAGSVRPDLMLGPLDEPVAAVDFKSGLAGIRSGWIKLLRDNLPTPFNDIPVIEINLK